jgi:purine-cytosine permease-like protein
MDSVNTHPETKTTTADGNRRRIEARSIDYVPLRERHGKVWHLFPVWFAGDAHLATIAVGVIGISLGGNLIWSAIAVVLGSFFGSFFMAFHSTQGPQLGLPQMVQSRPQFGFLGALLVWVVALVTYIGYTGFNQILVGSTLSNLASVPEWVSYVGYAVVGVLLAVVGYDVIHKASRWLTMLMFVVLMTFTIGMIAVHPLSASQLDLGQFALTPFLIQFFTAAVYQLSWSIYVSDYSRYLPPNVGVRSSFWWTYLGAGIGGAWMMLVGTLAAGMFPAADVVPAVIGAGDRIFPHFGTALLVISVLPLITIGTLNFYGGSLTLLSMLDSVKRVKLTVRTRVITLLVIGTLSTAIAFTSSESFLAQFGDFLTVLGYLFTPWTAINLVDFYVIRRGHYSIREIFNPRGMYGRWNWRGLLAYAIGFASMMPFAVVGNMEGPVANAMGGVDISMVIGLIVAVIVYWALARSIDLEDERRNVAIADRDLDTDAAPSAAMVEQAR